MNIRNSQPRKKWAWFVVAAALLLVVPFPLMAPASPSSDPYTDDPLGLIANYDLTSGVASSADSWEVWVCNTLGGTADPLDFTAESMVSDLNDLAVRYWEWTSNGAYSPSFVVGGTIDVNGSYSSCLSTMVEQSSGVHKGALLLIRSTFPVTGGSGNGSPGMWCSNGAKLFWCATNYPKNGRVVIVNTGGGTYARLPLSSVIHEMGHGISLPHSFTGLVSAEHPLREYDNPSDIMSGAGTGDMPVGTIAPNRYASGWISEHQVHVYEGGATRLTVSPLSTEGTQMLVIPTDTQGVWLGIGARSKGDFDNPPQEGVEAYVIDQTNSQCSRPVDGTCWGTQRSTTPYPARAGYPLAHVLSPGDNLTWHGTTVTVIERVAEGFVVEVADGTATPITNPDPVTDVNGEETPGSHTGRFTDDDDSVHEPDIDRIAELGVTRGCASEPEPEYCPDSPVTRAEMAAFLMRSIGTPDPQPSFTVGFLDVPGDVWYTNYVHAVAEMGIDLGENGNWRPDDPLTRLEMAYWLARVFDHVEPVPTPTGVFEDVNIDDWEAVEGLYASGVTRGCSAQPLLYCPDQSVSRAQMASFLIRALFPN